MTTDRHPDDGLIARYVVGEAEVLQAASLEQHLIRCADCRARIAVHVEVPPLEVVWERILERAQAPTPTLVERWLTRLRLPETDALLVAVAPSLRTSWLFGLAVTLGFVCLAGLYGADRGLSLFLLFAPLIPVAGVALAYGPDVDPAYEVSLATPYSAARMLLLRTAAVLATSLPLVLAAALVLPGLTWTTVGWLLPALAFTAVVLAASTWSRPSAAATVVAILWCVAVGAASVDRNPTAVLAPTPLFAYAAIGVAAVLVLRLRIHYMTLSRSL